MAGRPIPKGDSAQCTIGVMAVDLSGYELTMYRWTYGSWGEPMTREIWCVARAAAWPDAAMLACRMVAESYGNDHWAPVWQGRGWTVELASGYRLFQMS